jgi:hypothetical protein
MNEKPLRLNIEFYNVLLEVRIQKVIDETFTPRPNVLGYRRLGKVRLGLIRFG